MTESDQRFLPRSREERFEAVIERLTIAGFDVRRFGAENEQLEIWFEGELMARTHRDLNDVGLPA